MEQECNRNKMALCTFTLSSGAPITIKREKTRPLVSWIASLALTSTEFELVIRLVFSGIGQQYTEPLKPRVIHLQLWQNGLASRRKFF